MLGMPPNTEGEGDEELFPEWNEYLEMEKSGATGSLIDLGVDGNDATSGSPAAPSPPQADE